MNWEAIGAIGEITGALAVVITLIYLSIQLRHNTTTTRAGIAQALADSVNNGNLLLAGDPRLARIFRVGKFEDWESLTDDEKFSWSYLAIAACRSLEAVLTHERLKQADTQTVTLAKETLRHHFSSEGYKHWWNSGHGGVPFTTDFTDFVEKECL